MFKVGDKVKFNNSMQEGSGVVVAIDYDGDYLVKSRDIKQGHSATLSDFKQDDTYNWWFKGTYLSIDTQEVHTMFKVGDKVKLMSNDIPYMIDDSDLNNKVAIIEDINEDYHTVDMSEFQYFGGVGYTFFNMDAFELVNDDDVKEVGQKYRMIEPYGIFRVGDIVTLVKVEDDKISKYEYEEHSYYLYDADHHSAMVELVTDVPKKFKVGDRVKLMSKVDSYIFDEDDLNNKIAIVTEVEDDVYRLDMNEFRFFMGNPYSFVDMDAFELITDEVTKFKVGDKVKVVSVNVNDDEYVPELNMYVGSVGDIECIDNGSVNITFIDGSEWWFSPNGLEAVEYKEMTFDELYKELGYYVKIV